MAELIPMVLAMLATGIAAGILAGLLGVGGGIVVVPVLEAMLGLMGVDAAIRMHVAVATSLAIIIPTSTSSFRAHHQRGSVDLNLVRRWGPFVLIGAALGAWLASQVDSAVLAGVFSIVALIVAVKMLLPWQDTVLSNSIPNGPLIYAVPSATGVLSSMMGIGGGTLTVPALTLMNHPVHLAVGTSALFGLLISLPGTIGFWINGLGDPRLPPGSLGYVNWIGFLCIAPVTVFAAPLGAKLAHSLGKRQLSFAFGCFLLTVAARMAYRAFWS